MDKYGALNVKPSLDEDEPIALNTEGMEKDAAHITIKDSETKRPK